MNKYVIFLFLVFAGFAGISQTNPKQLLKERIKNADAIIKARVIDKYSFWDKNHRNIYTSYRLKSTNSLKGVVPEKIELIVKGGVWGDTWQKVSTAKEFNLNDEGLFLLKKIALDNRICIDTKEKYILSGGRYSFIADNSAFPEKDIAGKILTTNEIVEIIEKLSGKLLLGNGNISGLKSIPASHKITGFSPKVVTAGTGTLLSIYGLGFGNVQDTSTVWFTYSDMAGQIFTNTGFNIKTWNDSLIQLVVPSKAATGKIFVKVNGENAESNGPLTINYAHINMNFLPALLINTDNRGGYTWHLHSNTGTFAGAKEIIEKSINSWVCATSVPWSIGNQVSTEIGKDSLCTISFGTVEDNYSETLGQTNSYYKSAPYPIPEEWVLMETDIVLSENENWCFNREDISGDQIDFMSVILHELGHSHLIDHVNNDTDLMHSGLNKGEIRNIGDQNILCGEYVLKESEAFDYPKYKTVIPFYWEPPEIRVKGDTIISIDEFQAYQWYNKNGEIQDATSNKYIVENSGEYYLSVTNEHGCVRNSETVYVVKTSIDELSKNVPVLSVQPNPNNGRFTVSFKSVQPTTLAIVLFNSIGETIEKRSVTTKVTNHIEQFNIPHLNNGVYFLTFTSGENRIDKKIVIQSK